MNATTPDVTRGREVRFAESTRAARALIVSIPHVSLRATLAQAFRWNVLGIASLLPFVPTVKTSLRPVEMREGCANEF